MMTNSSKKSTNRLLSGSNKELVMSPYVIGSASNFKIELLSISKEKISKSISQLSKR